MTTDSRTSRTLRLNDQDVAIIKRLKQHYGVTSENEVIRMALRSAKRELTTVTRQKRAHQAE